MGCAAPGLRCTAEDVQHAGSHTAVSLFFGQWPQQSLLTLFGAMCIFSSFSSIAAAHRLWRSAMLCASFRLHSGGCAAGFVVPF